MPTRHALHPPGHPLDSWPTGWKRGPPPFIRWWAGKSNLAALWPPYAPLDFDAASQSPQGFPGHDSGHPFLPVSGNRGAHSGRQGHKSVPKGRSQVRITGYILMHKYPPSMPICAGNTTNNPIHFAQKTMGPTSVRWVTVAPRRQRYAHHRALRLPAGFLSVPGYSPWSQGRAVADPTQGAGRGSHQCTRPGQPTIAVHWQCLLSRLDTKDRDSCS